MLENLAALPTEELKAIFVRETRRFMQGIDRGLQFDTLKAIRVTLREIEAELQNRGIAM